MIRSLFLTCLLISIYSFVNAQQRFEIGVEGGVMNCLYKIRETQNNLATVPCISGFGGVTVRINTKKRLFVEAGVLLAEYAEGLRLKQQSGYFTGNHDEVLFIPLRLGYPVFIAKNFSIVPSLGITPSIKTLNQDGGFTSYEQSSSNEVYRYEYKYRELGKDLFFLLNGNVWMEWKFARRLKTSFGLSYFQGLTKISVADVRYKLNNQPEQTGQLIGREVFSAILLG